MQENKFAVAGRAGEGAKVEIVGSWKTKPVTGKEIADAMTAGRVVAAAIELCESTPAGAERDRSGALKVLRVVETDRFGRRVRFGLSSRWFDMRGDEVARPHDVLAWDRERNQCFHPAAGSEVVHVVSGTRGRLFRNRSGVDLHPGDAVALEWRGETGDVQWAIAQPDEGPTTPPRPAKPLKPANLISGPDALFKSPLELGAELFKREQQHAVDALTYYIKGTRQVAPGGPRGTWVECGLCSGRGLVDAIVERRDAVATWSALVATHCPDCGGFGTTFEPEPAPPAPPAPKAPTFETAADLVRRRDLDRRVALIMDAFTTVAAALGDRK